jgi:signal transduction histidine kinase
VKSFRNRLLLTFLLGAFGLMAALGFSHYQTIQAATLSSFEGMAISIAGQIAQRAVLGVFSENWEELERLAGDAFLIPHLSAVTFFRETRVPLFAFSPGKKTAIEEVPLPEKYDSFGQLSMDWGRSAASITVPVFLENMEPVGTVPPKPGRAIGYVTLWYRLDVIQKELSSVTRNFFLSEILLLALFGMLMFFLERWVSRPLVALADNVGRLSGGNLAARVDVEPGTDEIAVLAQRINLMAESLENYTTNLEAIIEEKTHEIKKRERLLMHQEKMVALGRMSANIAHEINNPLNFISLGLDILEQQEQQLQKTRGGSYESCSSGRSGVFVDIRSGFKRLKSIIDSLRKFSRSDESQVQDYSLKEVLDETLAIFRHEIKHQEVTLEIDVTVSPRLHGSTIRVQQILLNLFRNALDAFDEAKTSRPVLRITTQQKDANVILSFQDNGPGISAEHQKRIFEPFFTSKPPGKGTGLGLALCYELAAREGGTIYMSSGVLGGAGFDLALPLPVPPDPAKTSP